MPSSDRKSNYWKIHRLLEPFFRKSQGNTCCDEIVVDTQLKPIVSCQEWHAVSVKNSLNLFQRYSTSVLR